MSRLIVMDCSAAVPWVIPDESTAQATAIISDVLEGTSSLVVPGLWWYEMLNVLRSAVRRGRITETVAEKALFFLEEIPMKVLPVNRVGRFGVLTNALSFDLSAYDSGYLQTAHSIGAELITLDRDLLALQDRCPFIKSVSEY